MNSHVFTFCPAPAGKGQDGLKVAIQPNMSCQGWPSSAGSIALENYIALDDATAVRLLKQSGAKIVGSVHMSELGLGLLGNTAGRPVVENFADVSLITDNLGEARVAAACAKLFGFKPSYGIVSRWGLIGLIPSMECWGIAARDVSGIRSSLAAMCVADEQDFSMIDETLPDFSESMVLKKPAGSIGVAEGYEKQLTESERAAWKSALAAMEKAGFEMVKIRLPDTALFSSVHNIIGAVEASSSAGKYDGVRYGHRAEGCKNWNDMYLKSRGESFGTLIKSYLFQGAYFQFENYSAFENACRVRKRLVDETHEALVQVDWIAALCIRENRDAYQSSSISDIYEAFSFTVPASLTGLPAIQLPDVALCGNKDFGLQLAGRPMSDPELLELAAYLGPKKVGGRTK
ncbi:MAG: amidase family protein [Desulfobacterales bacterium]